jgi:hypothetical protein
LLLGKVTTIIHGATLCFVAPAGMRATSRKSA